MSGSNPKQEALFARINAAWIEYSKVEQFRARFEQPDRNYEPIRQRRAKNYRKDVIKQSENGTWELTELDETKEIVPNEKMCGKIFWEWMANKGPEELPRSIFTRQFSRKYEGVRKEDSDWLIGVIKKYENLQAEEENAGEAGAAQSESVEIEKKSGGNEKGADEKSELAEMKSAVTKLESTLAKKAADLAKAAKTLSNKASALARDEPILARKASDVAKRESVIAEKEGYRLTVPEPRKKKSRAQRRRDWDAASPAEVLGYLDDNNQLITEPQSRCPSQSRTTRRWRSPSPWTSR